MAIIAADVYAIRSRNQHGSGFRYTQGVFLIIASRNPYAHKSLIWFTVWSSVVHAAIMGFQALTDTAERGHLVGDVPALILVAIVLAVLMPRTAQASAWPPQLSRPDLPLAWFEDLSKKYVFANVPRNGRMHLLCLQSSDWGIRQSLR
jgi:hypothetical protein